MKITVLRQACCAQDDQAGPLDMQFSIEPDATLASLIQEIARSGFLQYSSSHNRLTGEVDDIALVEVFSPWSVDAKPPEFRIDPQTSALALLDGKTLFFNFRHV
ncbi:hypothetical protein VVD49_08260 [Uliginosibacterium sp. H3]|uniref:Uncharacterized protein n=1 Tax=Uliginosibacterium silvisoli TaxID=3114758 RepID=A0ABU6K199_9RHOO|nr:hypothetical protein [Uliginosibacterium sp. H3]